MKPIAILAIVVLLQVGAPRPSNPAPDLTAARDAAAKSPRMRSLVVRWRGKVVLEYYADGRASRLFNIKSASKSIISTLVGIAIERRLLKGVNQPIADFFPALHRDADERKRRITIEDLLTMRSGLESTSFDNYGTWVRSPNWVRFVLERPMVSDPGSELEYSTGSSHLLSAILTKATGKSTWQFAQEALATPLGIKLSPWPRDPQGIYFGGNDMLMTSRQMLAFGELQLNRGRMRGRQIVPQAWVDTSCEGRGRSQFNPDQQYGYGWWIRDFVGRQGCFAWGYGGQYIIVFRDLDLVVVTTSVTTPDAERRDYRRSIFGLVENHILGPLAGGSSSGVRP